MTNNDHYKFTNTDFTHLKLPKSIIIISMLYVTSFMFPMMMAYRFIQFGPLLLPGGTIFFVSSYLFSDISSETFGYQVTRQIVWAGLLVQMLTGLLIILVLHLPHPDTWHHESDFNYVLGNSLRYAIASTIGNFFGEFVNIYAITKFKILLRGKYFWLRSITSTMLGEIVLTIVVFSLTFIGGISSPMLLHLIISGIIYKVTFAAIFAFPAQSISNWLKKIENLDVYDYRTTFNPFRFKVDQPIYNKAASHTKSDVKL